MDEAAPETPTDELPSIGWQDSFYNNFFSIAVGSNVLFSVYGVLVELLFLVGSYPLMGWKSDFSFVIIACIALCGLQRDVFSLINCSLSSIGVLYPVDDDRQTIIRRVWLGLILLIHMGQIIFMTFSDIISMIWAPRLLYVAVWENSTDPMLLVKINQYSTYFSGGFNLVAFPILFLVLFIKGQLTFRKNHELRLTLHVTYVVVFETYLAGKSYFQWQEPGLPTGETILSTVLFSGAYFSVIISPYLLLNRNIRKRICCFEDSRNSRSSFMVARSQRISTDKRS